MLKVLIADDDAVARTALRSILSGELPLEIIEAADGQIALDILCDGLRPDLCIFDLKMPKMDGLELLQRMRRDPQLSNLKTIAASASRDRDTILALAKLKISGYLLKPYDVTKTITLIKQVLGAALNVADPTAANRNLLAKTVLIADDDDVARTALKDIIGAMPGWEFFEAKDGQDALTRLYGGLRPDLIFADLEMPRLDGFSLLQRIRDDPQLRNLRVVMISGSHDRDRVRALVQLQISGYLLKPFDAAKVHQTLRQVPGTDLVPTPPPLAPPPAAPPAPAAITPPAPPESVAASIPVTPA